MSRPSSNIPLQLTSFAGRKREIEEVKRLLSTTRLLMLTDCRAWCGCRRCPCRRG